MLIRGSVQTQAVLNPHQITAQQKSRQYKVWIREGSKVIMGGYRKVRGFRKLTVNVSGKVRIYWQFRNRG